MRVFLINILLLLAAATASAQQTKSFPKMDYHFSWDGQSSILKVDLFYDQATKDTTSFIYGLPEIGGQLEIFKVVGNIRSGAEDAIAIDSAKRKILIRHKTAGQKTLHYEINGALLSPAKHNNANEQFRPQLVPGACYSLSFNLFLQADTNAYKQITMVWDKWPAGFGYFSSADPESMPNKSVTIPISQIKDVYLAMDKQLKIDKYKIGSVPYYAVTSGRDSVNRIQTDIKPFFTTFFPAMANFWKDYDGADYFVSILPFLNEVPKNLTGYGLIDGFSMRYRGPYDKDKIMVIAHETSHKWIGNKLKIKQKGFENMWFEEGFNDYIAIAELAKTGMITRPDFIDYINNKNLTPHYKSPARTAPADSIEKYFWVNHYYEHLPYQRGFIFAFYFDNQIRLASGGKYTIQDFLLSLLKYVSTKHIKEMTVADFIKVASKYLPKERVSAEITKYLQQGQLLNFHNIKLAKGFFITYKEDVPVLSAISDADLTQFLNWK